MKFYIQNLNKLNNAKSLQWWTKNWFDLFLLMLQIFDNKILVFYTPYIKYIEIDLIYIYVNTLIKIK